MTLNSYLLVGICVIAALILFFKMSRENKVFIGAGLLFLGYGGYTVAKSFLDDSTLNIVTWIMRGVAVLMIIWMFTVLSGERAKRNTQDEPDSESEKKEESAEDKDAE